MNRLTQLSINRLQHVGIPITNKERSEAFYYKLGFDKVMEAPFQHEGGDGTCIMMQRDDMIVELYQMPEKLLPAIKARQDGHIDHIAFDVTDIDNTFRLLKENGFHIAESSPVFLKFWMHGCKYFNIIGPDGERLEFNEILRKDTFEAGA
jgi:catechol 2,3-dioxygenase-like lactoylglutathione lyase family enzyme